MVFASVGWNSTAKTTSFVVYEEGNKTLDECISLSFSSINSITATDNDRERFWENASSSKIIFLKKFDNVFLGWFKFDVLVLLYHLLCYLLKLCIRTFIYIPLTFCTCQKSTFKTIKSNSNVHSSLKTLLFVLKEKKKKLSYPFFVLLLRSIYSCNFFFFEM